MTGRDLTTLLIRRNGFGPGNQGLTGYLPKMIAELDAGDPSTYEGLAAGRLGGSPDPGAALAGVSGLDADARAFADTALRLAEVGRITQEAANDALVRLDAARRRAEQGAGLVDAFDAALAAAAKALPDQPSRVAFGSDYLLLRASDRTTAALDAMLARHFSEATLAGLTAMADGMSDAQVAQVFDRVRADNSAIDNMLVGQFQLQMFACQEDMEINSPGTIPAASARLREEFGWPEPMIAELEAGMTAAFYDPCSEFARHPRPGMNDPVTADIPALVMQGALDTQTAPSWGPLLASTLPLGHLAQLPESGHGTFIFSQCARDIGAAFLDDPEAPVDTACTAELIPAFLLPDGTWSR